VESPTLVEVDINSCRGLERGLRAGHDGSAQALRKAMGITLPIAF